MHLDLLLCHSVGNGARICSGISKLLNTWMRWLHAGPSGGAGDGIGEEFQGLAPGKWARQAESLHCKGLCTTPRVRMEVLTWP